MKPAAAFRASAWSLVGDVGAVLLIAALCLAGLGCSTFRRDREPESPAATITGPAGASLAQTGDAQTPATADTSAGSSALVIPAGTPVSIAADGTATFTAAEPVRIAATFSAFRAAGPGAFTPPAPPTPAEQARGWGVQVFQIALALGIAAAVFGLVRGWDFVMYGGAAVSAGAAFALFVASHPVLFAVLGLGLGAAVAGVVIWHTKLKRAPSPA